MNDLPPDLDRLFAEESQLQQSNSLYRCKCGKLIQTDMPRRCDCGEVHCFWTVLGGTVKRLEAMDLGHLNNCVRMLAQKMEEYPAELRTAYEEALDILYSEIDSRDKEIAQVTGIHQALLRSLAK